MENSNDRTTLHALKLLMPLAIIAFFGGLACIFVSTYIKTKSIVKAFVAILP